MMLTISKELINTGILQFGRFIKDTKVEPVRFCPEYLPAYPELLATIASLVIAHSKDVEVTHLLVNSESLALGVACSLKSKLSLVISQGRQQAAVYDLVGAYNSGDKAVLVMNNFEDITQLYNLISEAQSVGLEVQNTVIFLEMRSLIQPTDISIQSVIRLVDVVSDLTAKGQLSQDQRQAVLNWANGD